jgi:hypothetical protein
MAEPEAAQPFKIRVVDQVALTERSFLPMKLPKSGVEFSRRITPLVGLS